MSQERLYKVLRGPHVTEKAVSQSDDGGSVVLKVDINATKREIKQALKLLFEVDVASVRTIKVKGKTKNFGRRGGKRSDWKKAYITLAEGQTLAVETP